MVIPDASQDSKLLIQSPQSLPEPTATELTQLHSNHEDRYRELVLGLFKWLLFGRLSQGSCYLHIFLFFILLPLKIDQVIKWPWAGVFSPILIAFGQILIAPLAYIIFIFNSGYDHYFLESYTGYASFFSKFTVKRLGKGKPKKYFLFFTPILTLLAFTILLLINLNGLHFSWWLTFTPFFLFNTYFSYYPMTKKFIWGNRAYIFLNKQVGNSFLIVGPQLLSLALVLAALKLEGLISISWAFVMIPAFAHSLYIGLLISHVPFKDIHHVYVWAMCLNSFIITLLLLVLDILLVVCLTHHSFSFRVVFIPVYLLVVYLLVFLRQINNY